MLPQPSPLSLAVPVEAAFAVAREAKRPPIPSEWSQCSISEMLKACWHQDATKRPPFAAICTALEEEIDMLQQQKARDMEGGSRQSMEEDVSGEPPA